MQTERLYFREFTMDDAPLLMDLNSDPDVIRYTGDKLITDLEEYKKILSDIILPQYKNKMGRWAVCLKSNDEFIGWCGLVSGGVRRSPRGPDGISPGAVAGLPDSDHLIFSAGLDRFAVARTGSQWHASGGAGNADPDASGPRYLAREALRRRDYGPRFQGKRPLHWLLHLLHRGKHWRGRWAFSGGMGASASQRGESFQHGGIECLRHVLRRVAAV